MKLKIQLLLVLFLSIYLLTVLFSPISLIGYWTDVLISVLLTLITWKVIYGSKIEKPWLKITLRSVAAIWAVLVFGLLGLSLINPFSWDTFKMKTFYYQRVNGRIFNAYFKPVGAYAGGYGNFWITETPKYFPIIEIEKYYDRTVDWDFRADNWEGEPVNQGAVVKQYIETEILSQK